MKSKVMPPYIGANYYPEDWDESLLESDIEKMKQTGFNVVRIGEFAWKKDEPRENEYHFEWLHRVIDKMGEAGIAVIMGTPTATPPHWLVQKYPDMLREQENGRRVSHGGRRHCCSSNPHYREYSAKIVEKLAREFGDDENIIGWQIDNEIYAWNGGCFCEHCMKKFHAFLAKKYGTVEALNDAWNLNLFSQAYDSFEEIPAPRDTWHNPHIKLDWITAQHENNIDFIHMQADILHKYTNVPIGTDMMPFNGMDYRAMHEKLDVVQYNHYERPQAVYRSAMWMDYIRNVCDTPFWVTETQACWNGSVWPGQSIHPDGYIYMNTWLSFVLGGEANLYWLWRTHHAGHELMHGGVLDSCGRPTYTYEEIKRAAREMHSAKKFLNHTTVDTDVAMTFSSVNWNIQKGQMILPALESETLIMEKFYNPMVFSGVHPDVIDLKAPLSKYKLIFSQMEYTLEDGDFANRIAKWVKDGGTWVCGPLSDIRDANGARYENAPYGILEALTGVKQKYFVPDYDNDIACSWCDDGEEFHGEFSYELFEDSENIIPLARVVSGHSAVVGKICAGVCKVGKGNVILLGTFPDRDTMIRLVRYAAALSGIATDNVQGNSLLVTHRKGKDADGTIVLDLCGKGGMYSFDGEKTDLITGEKFKSSVRVNPYEVKILR